MMQSKKENKIKNNQLKYIVSPENKYHKGYCLGNDCGNHCQGDCRGQCNGQCTGNR